MDELKEKTSVADGFFEISGGAELEDLPRPETGEQTKADEEKSETVGETMIEQTAVEPVAELETPEVQVKAETDSVLLMIEKEMEVGLKDLLSKQSAETQRIFIEQGEKTAQEIRRLLADPEANAFKIHKQLTAWLKKMPGLSRGYIEKEAQKKTATILKQLEPIV